MARVEVKKFQRDGQGLTQVEAIPLKHSSEIPHEELKFGISVENNKFMHVFMEPILPSGFAFRIFLSNPATTKETEGAVTKNGIPHVYKDIVAINNPIILHQEDNVVFSAHVIGNQDFEDLPYAAD